MSRELEAQAIERQALEQVRNMSDAELFSIIDTSRERRELLEQDDPLAAAWKSARRLALDELQQRGAVV